MFLKKVEMRGFKSFADKTEVVFKEGVTCVVGPNGSGKSNITDAVRWVLGEQRVKTLRGSKMEDVIFSGTKHRKSLGLAEVKLTFDNTEQFFPLAYDEITVVRRVHRSGESEYYINQMPCRLKDIRELFMDTGIGREGYSIIGQGRIDEVLSNNKDERRLLFEEAAGIVKFKGKKQETEKKLKATTDNMLRVKDILSEIEDRVEPLKKESERATQYLSMIETLKTIEVNHFAKRYTDCEQNILAIISAKTEHADELSVLDERRSVVKTQYDAKDRALYEMNQKIRNLEASLHELNTTESKTIGEKQLVFEKITNTESNISRLQEESLELNLEIEAMTLALEAHREEEHKIAEEIKGLASSIEAVKLKRQGEQERLASMKTENESDREETVALLNDIEIKKSEIVGLKRILEESEQRKKPLLEELELKASEELDLAAFLEQRRKDEAALIDAQSQVSKKLSEAIANNQFLSKQREALLKAIEKDNQTLGQWETEKKLLENLEEEFEGYDKGVKEILKGLSHQSGIHGIVASLIDVPKKYETAIEVALGRTVQNIVCNTAEEAKESIDFLRKNKLGRVTFLPLEHFSKTSEERSTFEKEKGWIGIASKLLAFDAKYKGLVEHLLGRVAVVEDFDSALKLLRQKNFKFKIVTLDGDVLVPGGAITGGSFKSKVSNLLGRKRRIGELAKDIEKLEAALVQQKSDLTQVNALIDDNDLRLKRLRSESDTYRMDLLKCQNDCQNGEERQKTRAESLARIQQTLEGLAVEAEKAQMTIDAKESAIQQAHLKVDALQTQLLVVQSDIESAQRDYDLEGEKLTGLQIKMASAEQNQAFKEKEVMRLADDLKTIIQKKSLRETQIQDYEKQKGYFSEQSLDLEDSISEIRRKILSIQETLQEKQVEKSAFSEQIRALTGEVSSLGAKYDAIKEKMHRVELKLAKYEVEKDAVVAELWDKYEMSIGEALQLDLEVPNVDLKKLKLDIKLMGTVNVNAISEYEEVAERYKFLCEQRQDLNEAIVRLEEIIKTLDAQMIELFKANFEAINEHFKGTFKALFSGGDAELILADYDDLLECDIEIIAQPPGKKLQSINLLSGGEKALTAIALLFAILKTKPSPFCILDEIEAALDDVNVYRFAEFIKQYSERSQFVVITHRKGTMEIADTLYGVTMEEYGVSKVLSVRLEDVEDKFN